MKIGIVGNYGNDNNGDEAILQSIIKQVMSTFTIETENLTVFSNNPTQTSERYGVSSFPLYYKNGNAVKTFIKTYNNNKEIVKTFDLLIIGGGGILMDLYRREAPLFGSYAMMAKNTKVPYVIYGCGAGPLHTGLGKWFIRYMCKHAESISVRDPESAELLQSIGVKESIKTIGDPAFSLREVRGGKSDVPMKIGITAVPYYNAGYWPEGNPAIYNDYVEGMAKNLDNLAAHHDVEITFFATKFPQDAEVTKDIQRKMSQKDKITIIEENLLPDRILAITAQQDIIIGTRLHSLILATCTETPVMAIAYHHKVNDFMKLAHLEKYSFPIGDLHKNETYFLNSFNEMKENWLVTVEKTKKLSRELYDESMTGTQQFVEAIK
ncbi:polysaccharide pyruvyl transferase family protein [Sporosarcina limicola]|uniref:Polysaccharide pyruvyl transferase CsaB n=1 Tax=Sporosarcina limicola TaxID=34101 RepID=A0A927MMD9_9BACL|nr:polysaccharide pyruvyl transferase family protein [Sporosarcina limicola]MBE1556656.1 polysaccharide pyruvyl transferase CsaB [Sporosarcina limicola]